MSRLGDLLDRSKLRSALNSSTLRAALQSSTLRSATLAALIMWAPGAALLNHHHSRTVEFLFGRAAEERDALQVRLFEAARHRLAVGDDVEEQLGEPLEITKVDGESMGRFLRRYVRQIRRQLWLEQGAELGLELRLAVLGEIDADWLATAPLHAVRDLMLEEVPENFHGAIESLIEPHLEIQKATLETSALTTRQLADYVEDAGVLEDSAQCFQLETPSAEVLSTNIETVLDRDRQGSRFTVLTVRQTESADQGFENGPPPSASARCLVATYLVPDGGQLLLGPRIDETQALVRRGQLLRNLLLILGLPLALLVGWTQSRSINVFLSALASAAKRQAAGEVGARLHISPRNRELALATDTVNQMLEQLEQIVQTLARMSDSIAHDLRTPLSRLQGQLDLLKQHSDPSGELIEAVQDEADALLQTFNALLRIAQVESGRKKQGFRQFDLAEVVRDVGELYAPVFVEKAIRFSHVAPKSEVEYTGDRNLWMQALSNLVENALKYTPEGGEVRLELSLDGARPRVTLTDSGPGIPKSERENVFRRFYRLQRHRGAKGNGLGLSLVAAVCELHRAEIRLGGERGLVVEIDY